MRVHFPSFYGYSRICFLYISCLSIPKLIHENSTFMAGGAHSGRSHSRFNIQIRSKCLPLYKYIKSLQEMSTQFTLHTIAHWVDILDLVLCICSCSVASIASMEQRVGVLRMSPSSEDSCLCCTVKCYVYNLVLFSVGRVYCACGCTVLGTKIGGAELVNNIHSESLSGALPTWEYYAHINPCQSVSDNNFNIFEAMFYSTLEPNFGTDDANHS